jgi:tRNA-modifying protein YgfZ
MDSAWIEFLRQRGARAPADDGVACPDFGDQRAELAALRSAAILCDLSQFAVLGFAGADAQTFLQGQLTCDVREATRSASRPGALCTPKGRALATFRLWQDAGGYCMQLPAALFEPIRKRLSMYVLRAKVSVSDRSAAGARFGVAGPQSAAALAAALGLPESGVLPAAPAIIERDGLLIHALTGNRFMLQVPTEAAASLWARIAAHCTQAGDTAWRSATIAAGEAVLGTATQDQFVPQMLNLDLTGGIGFQKGCYTGQEIVARTQYLGKLKQRLYRAHLAADVLPRAGDALYSADFDGQATGTVIDAVPALDGGADLLAVIRTDSAATQALHWQTAEGPLLSALIGPDEPAPR